MMVDGSGPRLRNEPVWQAPQWYRALTLAERSASLRMATDARPPVLDDADEAGARLRAWTAQKPFDREDLFAQRLALDSLSEQDVLALLAEPAESLRARIVEAPGWLSALREAFADTDAAERLAPLLHRLERENPLAPCLLSLSPLLARALGMLDRRVQELRRGPGVLPFGDDLPAQAFLADVTPTVLFQVSKPVVLEMHIARVEGRLDGETKEARFEDFMRQLAREHEMPSFLSKYPVLARLLVETLDQCADYLYEFLCHLTADWEAIRAAFAGGRDPGLLVQVDAGRGDRHRRGRSVLLLRFSSGLQLMYKPKPMAVDVHFQELLSWLNDRGVEPPLRPLKILDRGRYGWSEFVAPSSCTSEDEVSRFYRRQGAYLALLYALNATDLHNENLIASGEHPMLVDLEALFHPQVHGKDPVLENLAVGALDQSVWQVGLLPRRIWADDDSLGVDMSGLGGQPGQMNPHRLVAWEDPGTDQMRLVRRRVELPVSENRPRLGDEDVDVLDYKESLFAGFTDTYRLLCKDGQALLTEQLPRFARDATRVLVRSTNVYGLLLYESYHPDLLRDALDRDRFFDRLWLDVAQRPYLARLIPAEKADLWRGDIPFFGGFPDQRTLLTSEDEPVVDFLDTPSLELVRRRLEQLGEDDLVRQTWIIEASLATLLMNRDDTIVRPLPSATPGRPVERDGLVAAADRIGQRIQELALQNDTGAYWLGVGPLDESTWGLYPTGPDLYAGNSGIALFLGYLGAVTGEPSHTLVARRALNSLRKQARARLRTQGEGTATALLPTVGAFEGLASIIYVLTHLGVLWTEQHLLDEAAELAEKLPPLISHDKSLDVIYGSAGCMLSLLGLHAVHPAPDVMDAAVQSGDRLLATAQRMPEGVAWTTLKGEPPLGGFSHGAAGIAFGLLQLAGRCGDERFRRCALDALEYDRSLFVPEFDNWADLRVFPGRKRTREHIDEHDGGAARPSMVAWCHGAPGIGLARLGALEQLDDERTRADIDVALSTTVRYGFAMNHSLCHGALGNLELLLVASQVLGRPEDHSALERATALVAASIQANGPVTGVPLGVETPGFMTGLAGMGYQLLRLAEPEAVPSALLLAPPPRQAHP
jgi:type 2 lantibiotic biosynthesis protein LanM